MSQLFDFSLGEKPWGKPKNIEKTKKPKNQNFSENVWSEVHVCFFLVFLGFFWFFGHDLEKTKKTRFFEGRLLKTQKKLRSFLVFCMDGFYMSSENLSKNQKKPEFFCFFALLQVRVPSKNRVFLVFSRS